MLIPINPDRSNVSYFLTLINAIIIKNSIDSYRNLRRSKKKETLCVLN